MTLTTVYTHTHMYINKTPGCARLFDLTGVTVVVVVVGVPTRPLGRASFEPNAGDERPTE